MKTHLVYRLYTTPSRNVLLIHQNLVLTPLSLLPKKKIPGKDNEYRLKVEEIAPYLALQDRSSIDQKNFEIID